MSTTTNGVWTPTTDVDIDHAGYVIPAALIDEIREQVLKPNPWVLFPDRPPVKRSLRFRFWVWRLHLRGTIHDRLFPECRAIGDDW